MNNRILYVTDLDGTLLNDDSSINMKALNTLNSLIEQGVLFSVATGRSYTTAKKILEPIHLSLPVLLINGVHVFDITNHKTVYTKNIDRISLKRILSILREAETCPVLYVMQPDGHVNLYYDNDTFDIAKRYIEDRSQFFYQMLGHDAVIKKPLEKVIEDNLICFMVVLVKDMNKVDYIKQSISFIHTISFHLYEERKTGFLSIEVFPKEGGKDNGLHYLKNAYKAQKVISFGDNFNDLSMKLQSDLFCVVENAIPEVKKHADITIPSNNHSGVISFIYNQTYKQGY